MTKQPIRTQNHLKDTFRLFVIVNYIKVQNTSNIKKKKNLKSLKANQRKELIGPKIYASSSRYVSIYSKVFLITFKLKCDDPFMTLQGYRNSDMYSVI